MNLTNKHSESSNWPKQTTLAELIETAKARLGKNYLSITKATYDGKAQIEVRAKWNSQFANQFGGNFRRMACYEIV